MNILRIAGATRELGKSQGYMGLPVRDHTVECSVGGQVNVMTTAWEPNPEELAAIAAGAPVYVSIQGKAHPPMMVHVGEPPQDGEG